MGQKILMMICMLIMIPTIVSAHTAVSSSTPKEGEVIQEDLLQLTVSFTEKIGNVSTMKLLNEENEIPFKQIIVEDNEVIGQLEKPLENGSYIINWNIVAKDGHPITGDIPFTVQKENEVIKTEVKEIETVNKLEKEESHSTNIIVTIIIAVLAAIILFGFIILVRKKE